MHLSKVMVATSALLLLAVGPALADKASEVAEQGQKPWALTDLPEFGTILADINETEPANNTCPGDGIASGDVYHGALTAGDSDWVTFSAAAGQLITAGTDADGTPTADTKIDLVASDCTTLLAFDDDSGPGLFSLISNFVAPYTGAYSVRVYGYSSTTTGKYKLLVSAATPPETECPLDGYKGQKFEVNAAIPDNAPAGMTVGPIVFPPDGSVILDLVVDLGIAHTWSGDVIARLTHIGPGGTQSVDLINRPGVPASTVGCSGNLIGTTADKYFFGTGNLATLGESSCPVDIPLQCYNVAPENPGGLTAFRGFPKEGEWWLFVSDSAALDTGTLHNFSVHILNDLPVSVESSSWGNVKASYK